MITLLMQGNAYVSDSNGDYMAYVCDTSADVAKLPTGADESEIFKPRPGSKAIVPDSAGAEATIYMLTNDRQWVYISGGA